MVSLVFEGLHRGISDLEPSHCVRIAESLKIFSSFKYLQTISSASNSESGPCLFKYSGHEVSNLRHCSFIVQPKILVLQFSFMY